MDSALQSLIADAWGQFEKFAAEPFVLKPSIPILFFGDYEQYVQSPVKVITVGLNPSRHEFPRGNCFSRFPGAEKLRSEEADWQLKLELLNAYFRTHPYDWFKDLEFLLNGFDCGYGGKISAGTHPNTALHTDLCTPLATDPTWTGLSAIQQARLESDGRKLWDRLLECLAPDHILVSVAEEYLAGDPFPPARNWVAIYAPSPAKTVRIAVSTSKEKALIVSGRAAQKPFGFLRHTEKLSVGALIRELISQLRRAPNPG